MKRGQIITIVVVMIIALVVISMNTNLLGNYTGEVTKKKTATLGASYMKTYSDQDQYVDCEYVTGDDGWSVTERATVQYYTKDGEGPFLSIDECEDYRTVLEFDCNDGIRYRASVICPQTMVCENGNCVDE